MNQVFVGGIALIIAFIFWSSKTKTKGSPFFKSEKNPFPNKSATSPYVHKKQSITHKKAENLKSLRSKPVLNQLSLNSIETKKKLTRLISGNPNDRLLAIQIASEWESKKAIPFLKRGLKDFDSRVVIAAAAAISSYKGNTIYIQKKSQVSRHPRNVSLMR